MMKRLPAPGKARYETTSGGMSNYLSPPLNGKPVDIEEAVEFSQLLYLGVDPTALRYEFIIV
jgi:hypothetical protein